MASLWSAVERFFGLAKGLSNSETPLNENAVRELVEGTESEGVEFKQKLLQYDKIAEYAVGIGNAGRTARPVHPNLA